MIWRPGSSAFHLLAAIGIGGVFNDVNNVDVGVEAAFAASKRKNVAFGHHTVQRSAAISAAVRRSNIDIALAASASTTDSEKSRTKPIQRLKSWAEQSGIKSGGIDVEYCPKSSGLGIVNTRQLPRDSVVISVPSSVALTVEAGSGPDDVSVLLSSSGIVTDRKAVRGLPWYAQFSLYLHKLDNVCSKKGYGRTDQKSDSDDGALELRPWLDSLPRAFSTPLHWSASTLNEDLQYSHLADSVRRQKDNWQQLYQKLSAATTVTKKGSSSTQPMTFNDFVWGCEIARSRAFSSGYGGSAFSPSTYIFTLLLVVTYLGLDLGTVEQAANGAAIVVCASILRDFVLPKLIKTKKYVICPLIDMCNHQSVSNNANVAFEYFGDAYSLATTQDVEATPRREVIISYGDRSNDQLLQYYGFVESNNPNDVYVMPPLRSWDIGALEEACGGSFAAGRLSKLENAGLLGKTTVTTNSDGDDDESNGNPLGGVVLTRAEGIDLAVIQALRVLVATDEEWMERSEAVGNFATEISPENERKARLAAKIAIEMELSSKPTTLQEDEIILKQLQAKKNGVEPEEILAVAFRIEKKKILKEALNRLG